MVPAQVAKELAELRAENARLLRLLELTSREAAPPGASGVVRGAAGASACWLAC
jgi:hypothetical protein